MSAVLPTSALPPAGGASLSPLEQPAMVRPATIRVAAKRRSIIAPTLAAVRLRLRHCGQQLDRVFIARVGEHLFAVALLNNLALEHHRYPVGEVLAHGKWGAAEK